MSLLAGVGFFNGKDKVADVTGDGETKFAFNAGAGVRIQAGARMSFFAEGRYISIRTEDAIGIIPISVGLRWGGN